MRHACSVLMLAALTGAAVAAEPLTLDRYLAQVREGNPAVRSAEDTAAAVPLMADEAGMAFSPLFRASGTRVDDRAQGSSALQPERTIAGVWSVGLSKTFFTGTTASVDYGLNYAHIFPAPIPGLPPSLAAGFFPAAPYYDARPSVSLTQSLLRDFLGGATDASVRRVELQAAAAAAGSRYRARLMAFQAEQAYWTASLARDVLEYDRASLERAQKLIESTEKKVALNLSEKSDLLQVQAGGKLRELNLRMAEQDVVGAERTLETWRGRAGATVAEELEHINARLDGAVAPAPAPSGTRLDVQAADLALAGARAGARETSYRARPDLNAFGTVVLNGHDVSAGAASGDSLDGTHPTYTVGAAFVAPLDIFRLKRVRSGYDAAERAAQRDAEAARLGAAQDWAQLVTRWQDVETKLALMREIEALQQQKYQAEVQRFEEGRTTTFQLLSFEEDYSQARLSRLRVGFERLLLEAQARLYRAE